MKRREFIKVVGGGWFSLLAGSSFGASGGGASARRGRLNVLFLIMDQHHHAIMGFAGNPVVKTPNLDRLAREGVRFTNAVCATPYCSPTRAALSTGRWPHTVGIVNNCTAGAPALTSDKGTTEGILFDRGYATEHIGKWHLGDKSDLECYKNSRSIRDRNRAYRDFIKSKRFTPGSPREGEKYYEGAGVYMTEFNYDAMKKFQATPAGKQKGQNLMAIGREATPAKWEFWGRLAEDAVVWLKANRDQSFMLTYSAGPPHALWKAPEPYFSMYDPEKVPVPETLNGSVPQAYAQSGPAKKGKFLGEKGFREMIRCYYAQVTMIDEYIGRLLDALDEAGLSEKTLVIYLSDHGDMQGSHGGMLGKSLPAFYEETVRVPLIMRLPGVIKAGTTVEAHANSVDILPTIMDYLGMPVPNSVQGRSLRPAIEGRGKTEIGYGFCERPGGRMVRSKDSKYCFFYNRGGTREELFDLSKDPGETTNLAGDAKYAERKGKMRKVLAKHLKETNDSALAKLEAL
ncbi:MAG: sulfatase family protein [Planctomycetota bacterium]|jgi:arylsulfatase A-like enzyme